MTYPCRTLVTTIVVLVLCSWANATVTMDRPAIYDRNATRFIQVGATRSWKREVHTQSRTISERGPGKVSVGYFANWGIYARNFQVANIVPDTLTHVLYAFADCDASSGNVILTDTYADQQKHYAGDSWSDTGNNLYGNLKQLYMLKQKNRNLKVLLSIGGWTYSQYGHFNFVTDATFRSNFVSSAVTLLEDNGFDGIDIDFEYPSTVAQGQGLADLVTELRSSLNGHASKKGDTIPYLVTVAVSAGAKGYGELIVPKMDAAVSFWNLMAYDYAGSFSTVSDDAANLYGGVVSGFSTDPSVTWYLSNGASANKITLGIPLYGHGFTGTDGIRKPFSGSGTGSFESGIWDYKALPLPGATVIEDTVNVASYSYDSVKKELISYDTPTIVLMKAAYINDKGLGGSMYWELSGDKVGQDSLIGRAVSAFDSLQQESNHLSFPGSKFDNIRSGMGGIVITPSETPVPTGSITQPPDTPSTDTPSTGTGPTQPNATGTGPKPNPTAKPRKGRGYCVAVQHHGPAGQHTLALQRRTRHRRGLLAHMQLAVSGLLRR